MKVSDIMTREVLSVREDDSLLDVARTMSGKGFHAIPVVDGTGRIAGIITESDFFTMDTKEFYLPAYIGLLQALRNPGSMTEQQQEDLSVLRRATAKDIMVADCITVDPEDDLEVFLELVREKQFNSIPVTDGNHRVVGIVTTKDALVALCSTENPDRPEET